MDLVVRRAGTEDAPIVAALLRAAFAEHRASYTPAAFLATCPEPATLAARLDEGPTWLALIEGRPAGTVSAREDADGVYVRSMGVDPASQGRGVGRALLAAAEAFARDLGAPRIHLSSTPFLLDAIRLYERAGFERVPGGAAELHGTPLVAMEKRL